MMDQVCTLGPVSVYATGYAVQAIVFTCVKPFGLPVIEQWTSFFLN